MEKLISNVKSNTYQIIHHYLDSEIKHILKKYSVYSLKLLQPGRSLIWILKVTYPIVYPIYFQKLFTFYITSLDLIG